MLARNPMQSIHSTDRWCDSERATMRGLPRWVRQAWRPLRWLQTS